MIRSILSGIVTLGVFAGLAGAFFYVANDGKAPWTEEAPHGEDWCEAHDTVLSTCEKCNVELSRGGTFMVSSRDPEPGECPNTLVRITLADGAAEEVNLQYHTVAEQTISERVDANAETRYPPSKYARIAPRISGIVREVRAVLGQEVEEGDVLAIIESAEFGQAKSEYLQTLAILDLRKSTFEREKDLVEKKISAGRELLEAKAALTEASISVSRAAQTLAALGMTSEQVAAIPDTRDTSSLLPVVAPFAGRVVTAAAVIGEIASPQKHVFAVAAMRRFWVTMDVYEADLAKIELGQRVYFRVDGIPGQRFRGKVVAIGGEVDDRTRTVPVFADVKNTRGLLRAQMFGHAQIVVAPPEAKLLVPKEAVQSDGDCSLVFVAPKKNVYMSRGVELGRVFENGYEVVSGLAVGEKVVTVGSFLLKTEVLRGQMGAG